MEVIVYKGNDKTEIKGVENITWSQRNIYIDVMQLWNGTTVRDEPFIFPRDEVTQILINFN